MVTNRPVLVTGATGYVDGRLIPALLQRGCRVRAMARSVEKLSRRPWAGRLIPLGGGSLRDSSRLPEEKHEE